MSDTNQRYHELQELCDRIKAAKPEAQALIQTIGVAITAAATSAREKALQEAADAIARRHNQDCLTELEGWGVGMVDARGIVLSMMRKADQ